MNRPRTMRRSGRAVLFPRTRLSFRYHSYLQRFFSQLPQWSLRELLLFIVQFNYVCTRLLQRRPFVYHRGGTLSLRFNLMAIQSEMRSDAPNELIVPYTRTMMGFLLFKPQPQKILMVGLGGGSLAKYCHAKLPEASIVVAESNPDVMALRDVFHIPPDEPRFQVLCEDGAILVGKTFNCVDVLLVDGFDLRGQPAQLCTQRFYRDCYRSLAPEGLMVVNLSIDDPNLERSHARLRSVFDSVVLVESADGANKVLFASKGAGFDLPYEQIHARLGRLEQHHSVDLQDTFERIRVRQYLSRSSTLQKRADRVCEADDELARLP